MAESLKRNIHTACAIMLGILVLVNGIIRFPGCKFQPISYGLLIFIYLAAAVLYTVLSCKNEYQQTAASRLWGMLMPLPLAAWIISMLSVLERKQCYFKAPLTYAWLFIAIASVVCFIIFLLCAERKWLKKLAVVFFMLWSGGLFAALAVCMLFDGISHVEIEKELSSPDGRYYVWIQKIRDANSQEYEAYAQDISKQLNILIGKIKKCDIELAVTDEEAITDMEWVDCENLRIGNVRYIMDRVFSYGYYNMLGYSKRLKIYVPARKPDYVSDTHGGFLGDGDFVKEFFLTDEEIRQANENIRINNLWKQLNEESIAAMERFFPDNFQGVESGYYCFYDKQTKTYPKSAGNSRNFIFCEYSEEERVIKILEYDL